MRNKDEFGWLGRSALGLALMALCLMAVVTFGATDADAAGRGQTKVTICHYPPGNPANVQTITIGEPAVEPHVRLHGDTIGPCDLGDGDDDDDDGGGDDDGGDDDGGDDDCDGDDCGSDDDG
ncbi:MAG: hypothetical protein K0U98_16300 [Deltaproteobacteria bacterium]|nr:hypothetical protein [Deltaproteobacteria bacterium]